MRNYEFLFYIHENKHLVNSLISNEKEFKRKV